MLELDWIWKLCKLLGKSRTCLDCFRGYELPDSATAQPECHWRIQVEAMLLVMYGVAQRRSNRTNRAFFELYYLGILSR